MKVKKGNRLRFDIKCTDENGDALTNLSSATAVRFDMKTAKDTTASLVTKTLGATDLSIDTPTTGYIRITLSPTDTAQSVSTYNIGLELQFGASNVQEITLMENYSETEIIEILQDTV
jgi:hypothetical protein